MLNFLISAVLTLSPGTQKDPIPTFPKQYAVVEREEGRRKPNRWERRNKINLFPIW